MKIKKRILSLLMATVAIISVCAVPVSAVSDSETKSMKGNTSVTSYSCNMYWKNNFWDTELHADGYARTVWYGMVLTLIMLIV